MSTAKKRMGGLGSLSSFSTTAIKPEPVAPPSPPSLEPEPTSPPLEPSLETVIPEPEPPALVVAEPAKATATTPAPPQTEAKPKAELEKLVTVNIKIAKTQQQWLAETATQVRDNNDIPVPPSERVYPQHLIGVAIDLLRAANVDWGTIRNTEELKKVLNL